MLLHSASLITSPRILILCSSFLSENLKLMLVNYLMGGQLVTLGRKCCIYAATITTIHPNPPQYQRNNQKPKPNPQFTYPTSDHPPPTAYPTPISHSTLSNHPPLHKTNPPLQKIRSASHASHPSPRHSLPRLTPRRSPLGAR